MQFTDLSTVVGGCPLSHGSGTLVIQSRGQQLLGPTKPLAYLFLPGHFDVTLISVNTTGCSDTIVKPLNVTPLPVVAFTTDEATCLGGGIGFMWTLRSWTWGPSAFTFGTLAMARDLFTCRTPHILMPCGEYEVTLSVTDTATCETPPHRA